MAGRVEATHTSLSQHLDSSPAYCVTLEPNNPPSPARPYLKIIDQPFIAEWLNLIEVKVWMKAPKQTNRQQFTLVLYADCYGFEVMDTYLVEVFFYRKKIIK